ncbi:MAG: helix-turn-helix domain-containing protein [Actinomycetota bacterium]|nr:helix-turn-helix domain-containing protein [Actinomycetota bacterium]
MTPSRQPALGSGPISPDEVLIQLGARVGEVRRRTGLTLAAAAERNGVSPGYISQIEAGIANPTVRALSQVAHALQTDIGTLFGAAGDPPDPSFPAYHSPLPAAATVGGISGIWDLTAAGSRRLAARLVHGEAGDHAQPVVHSGEEFLFVLHGSCTLHIDGTARPMSAGEACHLHAATAHQLTGLSPELTLVAVLSQN